MVSRRSIKDLVVVDGGTFRNEGKRCGGTAFSSQRNLSYYEEVYSSIEA